MNNILRFHDGTGARPYIIGTVKLTDTGVEVTTTSGDQIVFLKESHPQIRAKIAETIIACIDAGKNFVQPDWPVLFAQWREELGLAIA